MIEEVQTQEPTSQAAAQADEKAQTSDTAQGEVVPAQTQTQTQTQEPAPPQGAAEGIGGGEGAVIEAEHAMATVKAKASALHTLLSNVGHFATLPVVEVEALIAEINYLLGIVRAKL